MGKNRRAYFLVFGFLCTPFLADGIWWSLRPEKKPQNYEREFGKVLRSATDFTWIPKEGPIYWYHILGIEENAPDNEVKKQYRTLSKQYHTDANGKAARALMQAINEAKEEFETTRGYVLMWDGSYTSVYNPQFAFQGPGKVKSLQSVIDLLGQDADKVQNFEWLQSDECKSLMDQWKRFYIAKYALIASGLLIHRAFKKFSTNQKYDWITKNKFLQPFIERRTAFKEKHPHWSAFIERGGFIALTMLYPLFRFRKLFEVALLFNNYPFETRKFSKVARGEDISVFYMRKLTCIQRYSNGNSQYIYESTCPIGYLPAEQARRELINTQKAEKMSAAMLVSGLAAIILASVY